MIAIRDLRKIYKLGAETVHALAGVDLDIGSNEFVAIMGPSGSGKSTMMNILGCLDRPTSGEYTLNGRHTHSLGPSRLARVRNEEIGFIFQSFELLPKQTALKNVTLPMIYSRQHWLGATKRARLALERVGLAERMSHRPNQLSGGQRQRVAIARALVSTPPLLLADEPTGNLDSRTSDEIMQLFTGLNAEGQTIVMVTHEDDMAAYADRLIWMVDGKGQRDGPTRQEVQDAV